MSKRGTNDQQHIIDAIDRKDYGYVWEQVKFVGYKKLPDINDRYTVFNKAIKLFDTELNNNFIQFYLSRIGFATSKVKNSRITQSRGVIDRCKNEYISPTDCEGHPIAKEMRKWKN